MNKFMKVLKNNTSNILFVSLGIVLLFSTDAKAFLQQSLMKVGFFKPNLENVVTKNIDKDYLDVNLINNRGEVVTLADFKGKVVFINFWATWCPPCIAEMPSIQILHDKFKDDSDVVILTVEIESKKEKAKQFMKRKKLTLPVYYPNSNLPIVLFDGTLPTTVILDKEGNIAHKTLGMADYSGNDIVDFLKEIKAMHE
ncbi:TlpA family protein disulfide reductase [Faecalibacter sp. WQ 117]|uniref:TlpA family protein disulfide reductase n=2 Tax=Faecalibacter rhinopitheci TaxID=2779678 RepID=A0A8J7FRP4_9FLAO|nr:TlpA family protein disulfide reductase [Faecalibacter rhinopitheci]